MSVFMCVFCPVFSCFLLRLHLRLPSIFTCICFCVYVSVCCCFGVSVNTSLCISICLSESVFPDLKCQLSTVILCGFCSVRLRGKQTVLIYHRSADGDTSQSQSVSAAWGKRPHPAHDRAGIGSQFTEQGEGSLLKSLLIQVVGVEVMEMPVAAIQCLCSYWRWHQHQQWQ